MQNTIFHPLSATTYITPTTTSYRWFECMRPLLRIQIYTFVSVQDIFNNILMILAEVRVTKVKKHEEPLLFRAVLVPLYKGLQYLKYEAGDEIYIANRLCYALWSSDAWWWRYPSLSRGKMAVYTGFSPSEEPNFLRRSATGCCAANQIW